MSIRWRMAIISTSLVLLSAIMTTGVAVYNVRLSAREEISAFREEEMRKVRQDLRNMVDIAWTVAKASHEQSLDKAHLQKRYGRRLRDMVGISHALIKRNYDNTQDRNHLEKFYGLRLKEIIDVIESILISKQNLVDQGKLSINDARQQAIAETRNVSFNSVGYVWITDNVLPYPKMVMHPTMPSLNGKRLDDATFNCALGKKKNLFQAMAEICQRDGGGFVDYLWPKPSSTGGELSKELLPKLSYVKLYEPWGWIIGTGVYIDDAVAEAKKRTLEEVRNLEYDSGTGYFWITDHSLPYPTMIMHPQKPELNGAVMASPEFNCAFGKNKNLFQAMAEICRDEGAGFVDYRWPKPGNENVDVPKISYVKLFEPWGWIVGTGVYLDDAALDAKRSAINEIRKLRFEPDGYFWINDTSSPIPRMLMHPILPELDGKVMDESTYNCIGESRKNLFQAMVETCQDSGQGFISYDWPKPMPDDSVGASEPKLSFVKIFKPWNCLIGSGVYIDHIYREINRKEQEMLAREKVLTMQILLFAFLVVILGVAGSEIAAGTLSRPLLTMIDVMKRVDIGSLESTSLRLTGSTEIRELGGIFNRMTASLHKAIIDLRESTRARERIEGELNVARDIQMSIIPKLFPPFPDHDEFDIYAIIDTAREVGGDLYDFFMLDDDHLAFAIGDVSGKGVPASLFMAVTLTLFRAKNGTGSCPGETLTQMNDVLCADNEMMMFVTFFAAVLNIRTGAFEYTNAGHNPPLLVRDGNVETLPERHGTALGVLEDQSFSSQKRELKRGDTLLLFTDGVTEAMDSQAAFYGEDRLEYTVKQHCDGKPEALVKSVFRDVKTFIADAEQADDITMLALQVVGE